MVGWLVDFLWHINPCGLFNAKSCLYIYIYIYKLFVCEYFLGIHIFKQIVRVDLSAHS